MAKKPKVIQDEAVWQNMTDQQIEAILEGIALNMRLNTALARLVLNAIESGNTEAAQHASALKSMAEFVRAQLSTAPDPDGTHFSSRVLAALDKGDLIEAVHLIYGAYRVVAGLTLEDMREEEEQAVQIFSQEINIPDWIKKHYRR